MLRASGVQWDLRKVDHYECYDEFDWQVEWQTEGDCLARYLVRIGEMRESTRIIQQALKSIPGGPYENLEARRIGLIGEDTSQWNDFEYQFISKKPSPTFKLPRQEHYVRVEAPKGELGVFLIGDDSLFPWRWKIRPPGFINLQILPQLLRGVKLADIMTILGSIDIIMGEVDR
jgi:NAD(P)H-quinone oxidoreductase subunit H